MQILPDQTTDEKQKLLNKEAERRDYGTSNVVVKSTGGAGSTIIEPVLFLFLIAKSLSETVITNMLEYRTCRTDLALPATNCTEPLSATVEDLVQPTTADIIMWRALIEAFTPSCLAILIGPWSDANGRKPFLVFSLAGASLSYMCWGCLALFPELHTWVFLLASIPLALSGGSCSVFLLCYCYISDITDEFSRPFRMSVLALATSSSSIFGTACAPLLLAIQHTINPYPLICFLSTLILAGTTLYTQFCIQESVDIQQNRERRFFLYSHITDLISTCFKERDGYTRSMTLLIVATLMINIFIMEGEWAVLYLASREMFSWQLTDFTQYSCFSSIVYGVGALAGVWLFNTVLRLPNALVSAILMSTRCARSAIKAVAQSGLYFYLSILVSCFSTAWLPLCRTELSILIPKQDLGKVFAFAAFLESVSPIPATPLYTYIYKMTFLFAPGTVFWISLALFTVCVFMLLIVDAIQRISRCNDSTISILQEPDETEVLV